MVCSPLAASAPVDMVCKACCAAVGGSDLLGMADGNVDFVPRSSGYDIAPFSQAASMAWVWCN